jgi:hypothetical protein
LYDIEFGQKIGNSKSSSVHYIIMAITRPMVDSNDTVVSRRGASGLFIVGIIVIIVGLGIGFFLIDDTVEILSVIIGIILIISSFIYNQTV